MYLTFIYLLILFYNPHSVKSHDIEVEGVLRIGNEFLKYLKNNIRLRMNSDNHDSSLRNNDLSAGVKSRKNTESSENSDTETIKTNNNNKVVNDRDKNSDTNEDSEETEIHDNNKMNSKTEHIENNAKEIPYDKYQLDKYLDTKNSEDTIKRSRRSINNKDLNTKISDSHVNLSIHANKNDISINNNALNSTRSANETNKLGITFISNKLNPNIHLKRDETNKNLNQNSTFRAINELNYFVPQETPLTKDNPRVKNFLDHIIYDEVENIEKVAESLQEKIALERSVFLSLLKATCANYTRKMKRYVFYINSQETHSEIDREYLYLDLVASSNMLLYSEEKKLFKTMVGKKQKEQNNLTQYDLETLKKDIYTENINHRKRQFFYICEIIQICRAYPGISDYFAELITELLKLPDNNLKIVVKTVTDLIKKRPHFFKSFIKGYVADMIGEKLEVISLDLYKLRELLTIVKSIIIQRFKLTKTTDQLLQNKTKAVRILLDIIDKTFSLAAGDELTVLTFDTAVKAIQQWALGKRDKVDIPLRLLLEHAVGVVRFNWSKNIRSEMAMLTEVIMTGETDLKVIYKELFARGSPFVRYNIVNFE